jgi:hypothetical protein
MDKPSTPKYIFQAQAYSDPGSEKIINRSTESGLRSYTDSVETMNLKIRVLDPIGRINLKRFSHHIFLVVVCLQLAWMHVSSIHMVAPLDYFNLKSSEPFVYRTFWPMVLSFIGLENLGRSTSLNFPADNTANLAALLIDFFTMYFTLAILLSFSKKLFEKINPGKRDICVFLMIGSYLWCIIFSYLLVPNRTIFYPYDFTEQMFIAVSVYLSIARFKWLHAGLIMTCLVAGLNKETAVFYPVMFLLFRYAIGKMTSLDIAAAVIATTAAFLSKYLSLMYLSFVNDYSVPADAQFFELQIVYNIEQMTNPLAWLSWLGAFGGLYILIVPLLSRVPRRILVPTIMILLCWVAIMFVVGISREMRLLGPMGIIVSFVFTLAMTNMPRRRSL